MKGSLHTDELMSAVVFFGHRTASGPANQPRFRHVRAHVSQAAGHHRCGNRHCATLEDKRDICQNAIDLAHSLGLSMPKVAILSAVETVTTKIPSTIDAAALCKMADRGQITGALLDGPLAMDNAISFEAAKTKGIASPVAGEADILVAPDLEAGNVLAKLLTFLANADAAGLVLGARVPIILTTRADNVRTRMASCGVALLVAQAGAPGKSMQSRYERFCQENKPCLTYTMT